MLCLLILLIIHRRDWHREINNYSGKEFSISQSKHGSYLSKSWHPRRKVSFLFENQILASGMKRFFLLEPR